MKEEEIMRIADAWIAFTHTEHGTKEYEALFPACEEMFWYTSEKPAVALDIILRVLARDTSARIVQNLAAGPLEDLLVKNGEQMIARIEDEAQRNPAFKKLLGGVWQNAMSDEIWLKVQSLWNRHGWDGIPE